MTPTLAERQAEAKAEAPALLRRTADRIDRLGWRQNTGGGECGPNCIGTALLHAREGSWSWLWGASPNMLAYDALVEALGCDPVDWNDTPGREQWEVVGLLRTVADKIEGA